jgi:heme exporter protein D
MMIFACIVAICLLTLLVNGVRVVMFRHKVADEMRDQRWRDQAAALQRRAAEVEPYLAAGERAIDALSRKAQP